MMRLPGGFRIVHNERTLLPHAAILTWMTPNAQFSCFSSNLDRRRFSAFSIIQANHFMSRCSYCICQLGSSAKGTKARVSGLLHSYQRYIDTYLFRLFMSLKAHSLLGSGAELLGSKSENILFNSYHNGSISWNEGVYAR